MGKNKSLTLLAILLILTLSGCIFNQESYYLTKMNNTLKEQKSDIIEVYERNDLLNHFPDPIKKNVLELFSAPPSCPPIYKCSAQFGYIYLICKIENTENLIPNDYIFKTTYINDSNIVINLMELRREIFPVEKCNRWHYKQYPIPYFESFNFNLGETEIKKIINGELKYNITYKIPLDLIIYVIAAEPGNFWIEKCNEQRPISLKEWQNGYSRGIAISEKENIIVYWTIIW